MNDLRTGLRRLARAGQGFGWGVTAFVVLWTMVVVLPLIFLVAYTFMRTSGFRVDFEFTLENWASLISSGRWQVVLRTLRIALTITFIELMVALPFALWLAKSCRSLALKAAIIAAITVPFFLDLSSRTIVWRAVLGTQGLVNAVLLDLGVVSEPVSWLLFSEFAIHFGMLGPYFPTMLLPIFLSLQLIEDEYILASYDLGGSPFQTFWWVTLPLAMPGIIAGTVFTLVPTMADYVVPGLLGGFQVVMLSTSVESALSAMRYPVAAMLSAVVIGILGIFLALFVAVLRRANLASAPFAALSR